MTRPRSLRARVERLASPAVLALASAYILLLFLLPVGRHAGINHHPSALFVDMVEGRAERPYVQRPLLPLLTRLVTQGVPGSIRAASAEFAATDPLASRAFRRLGWEPAAALAYGVAALLMWGAFAGFAHWFTELVAATVERPATTGARTVIALIALFLLPPFFRFTSFLYDPPQLLLWTACLAFLAQGRRRAFLVGFGLACLNKETALLLIPIYLLAGERPFRERLKGWMPTALVVIYLVVRGLVAWVYRGNAGGPVEFHLLDHNLMVLTRGWTFSGVLTALALLGLLAYQWRTKAPLLRTSFLIAITTLAAAALFCGYLDEWRDYYEAYPSGLALMIHSGLRIGRRLGFTIPGG